ncbi:MAG TPA: arginase family protein, partial [Solirubrobacteraceae bacterium]|nr:arginase family protein [Solirubrobacteraceae bacterium]
VEPELVGESGTPREARWEEDLRDGRDAIAAAGAALEAALDGGAFPVLLASDCTIAIATLPALARREPDVRVVWLDAHGDFNTPDTTASGYLGGMCLAAACGRWDAGFGPGFDPRRVVLSDGRDLDAPEREEMERAQLTVVAPADVPAAVRGQRVFVHLDLDVLDPSEMPFSFPAHGGMPLAALRALLAELARAAEIAGVEVTSTASPGAAGRLAEMLEPLIP